MTQTVTIIGGGLAGTETAWQIANRDIHVHLYEMRPNRSTEAHITDRLAELVCSNSMGSTLPDRALGILKNEMLRMGSMVIATASNMHCQREALLRSVGMILLKRLCRKSANIEISS